MGLSLEASLHSRPHPAPPPCESGAVLAALQRLKTTKSTYTNRTRAHTHTPTHNRTIHEGRCPIPSAARDHKCCPSPPPRAPCEVSGVSRFQLTSSRIITSRQCFADRLSSGSFSVTPSTCVGRDAQCTSNGGLQAYIHARVCLCVYGHSRSNMSGMHKEQWTNDRCTCDQLFASPPHP